MAIEITGRHIEIPPREKQRVEERLTRMERHTGKIDEARLVFTGEKHRILAEASIASGRETWKAREESADLPTAVVSVLDKIEAQA
jgi:ribosomal subunit interface protein